MSGTYKGFTASSEKRHPWQGIWVKARKGMLAELPCSTPSSCRPCAEHAPWPYLGQPTAFATHTALVPFTRLGASVVA